MTKDKLIKLFKDDENKTEFPECAIFITKDCSGNNLYWDGQYWDGIRGNDHRSLLYEFCEDPNSDNFDYYNIFKTYSILEIRPEVMEIYGDIENDYYLFSDIINEYFSEYELVQFNENN